MKVEPTIISAPLLSPEVEAKLEAKVAAERARLTPEQRCRADAINRDWEQAVINGDHL